MSAATDDPRDNAVWHALRGAHRVVAEGDGRALRYHPDVSVFHAMADDAPESWAALAELTPPPAVAVVFRVLPQTPPPGWEVLASGDGYQMVLPDTVQVDLDRELAGTDAATGAAVSLRELGDADVPAMQELVAVTEPGPFRPRTVELGGYVGVFHDDRLVAMAGRRLRVPGWCEVSAVCTHPDVQRRGYGSLVTRVVAQRIQAEGDDAMLHVASTNTSAHAAYLRLGFVVRATALFAVYRAPGSA